jgi:hypothetical protein
MENEKRMRMLLVMLAGRLTPVHRDCNNWTIQVFQSDGDVDELFGIVKREVDGIGDNGRGGGDE